MKRMKLICKDCKIEIFVDVNMVMVKDSLWKKICDKYQDSICDICMGKRLGRPITEKDFKKSSVEWTNIIPCNYMWLERKKKYKH